MATSTSISLPGAPKGLELEDFVAGLIQASGAFVEKNIANNAMLELDAVVTSYAAETRHQSIVEVKGGRWGFRDIFTLIGWMTYLNVERGLFIVLNENAERPTEFYNAGCAKANVSLIVIDDLGAASEVFASNGFKPVEELAHSVWRYSFWLERILYDELRKASKAGPGMMGCQAALDYYRLVNNGVFFMEDAAERAGALYEAYKTHPKVSRGLSFELDGGAYTPDSLAPSSRLLKAMLDGTDPLIQASMYVEHRARLAILKAAVDYIFEKGGTLPWVDLDLAGLPVTFQRGIEALAKRPFYWLYPAFWQVFLWGWGGFILNENRDKDFEWLSAESGLPVSEIPSALEAFDLLFPMKDKWLVKPSSADYELLRLMPVPFRGLGAFRRLNLLGKAKYSELNLSGYTGKDLAGWHNSLHSMLLAAQDPSASV